MATLAPAGRRQTRPAPPESTLTPVAPVMKAEFGARLSQVLPGFAAVVAVSVLMAGFVALLIAG